MRNFNIKYTNESPNRIYEIHGKVSVNELQILEQQIKDNEANVCNSGRGLYSFSVIPTCGDEAMILTKGAEYTKGHGYIVTLTNYDPNC